MDEIFPRVFRQGSKILTMNPLQGRRLFTEQLASVGGTEYRVWDPNRSKPAAAIAKGLRQFPLKPGSKVLYLGIASGQTASYFSNIIGPSGIVYGIEISERCFRELLPAAKALGNIMPILADARKPETYGWVEPIDVIMEDVATNDQSEIMIRNAEKFLKKGGHAMMVIKSRSIDVTKEPDEIYKQEERKLSKHFRIVERVRLDPYEKDHMFYLMTPK
ncbi:MAG: fibrillarin-like rRNA/tRNA 2'-O-methyltransferase [Candidatus Aenigmarchaeota archaeon]|nr:fibrillarin-like rRNA/tRNA 2'-O-methyltransferase [Candidatus Aenigmarchaeota archaeon]